MDPGVIVDPEAAAQDGDLADHYRVVLLDLDGTLFRGRAPIPGAVEAVTELRRRGVTVRYLTNNASRGPGSHAAGLRGRGFPAEADEVSSSGQAAAAALVGRFPPGSPILVVGTDDLRAQVEGVGMRVVAGAQDDPVAVVQGFSPELTWAMLAEACLVIRDGAMWVATNQDVSLPSDRGLVPGNGAMVAALRAATGAEPLITGKPARALYDYALQSAGAGPALMVGDRLDTDIAGGAAAGLDTVAVLSGVSRARDVLAAVRHHRPQRVAADVTGLLGRLDTLLVGPRASWQVDATPAGSLTLRATDGADPGAADQVDALRALCAAWWAVGEGVPAQIEAADPVAKSALAGLGLDRP